MAEQVTTIDFNSVGGRPSLPRTETEQLNRVPIGIKTPMRLGTREIWAMNHTLAGQIRDNLKNLLATNWGERLGRYKFGANLKGLSFEYGRDNFNQEASVRIKDAVSRWMPYIVLKVMRVTVDDEDILNVANVDVNVIYDVPQAGLSNQAVKITLTVGG